MLPPRRGCLGYSKVYCDVRKRWFLAWNQSRHITYYIFHIQYTNSKISVGLPYIRPHFVRWHRLIIARLLVRNLVTSSLVRASVSLLTFQTATILAPLWFTYYQINRDLPIKWRLRWIPRVNRSKSNYLEIATRNQPKTLFKVFERLHYYNSGFKKNYNIIWALTSD